MDTPLDHNYTNENLRTDDKLSFLETISVKKLEKQNPIPQC